MFFVLFKPNFLIADFINFIQYIFLLLFFIIVSLLASSCSNCLFQGLSQIVGRNMHHIEERGSFNQVINHVHQGWPTCL